MLKVCQALEFPGSGPQTSAPTMRRGKWMIAASSGQKDTEVGGLDTGFNSPGRAIYPSLKVRRVGLGHKIGK